MYALRPAKVICRYFIKDLLLLSHMYNNLSGNSMILGDFNERLELLIEIIVRKVTFLK